MNSWTYLGIWASDQETTHLRVTEAEVQNARRRRTSMIVLVDLPHLLVRQGRTLTQVFIHDELVGSPASNQPPT